MLKVTSDITFIELVHVMLGAANNKAEIGLVVVENGDGSLFGVITDGDVRRALGKRISYDSPIDSFVVRDPVTIPFLASCRECLRCIKEHEQRLKGEGRWYRPEQILVVDDAKCVVGVVDKMALLHHVSDDITAVNIGLGYIGLPFSAILANAGIPTCGVDINEEIVALAQKGQTHFFEPGLEDLLQARIASSEVKFGTQIPAEGADVYFVSVGTPLNSADNSFNIKYLAQAMQDVGKHLVGGELVAIRSTVVLGTTRKRLIPILEKESGLTAGVDFNVVFAPERVVEGNVIDEYFKIPQVIGGYTKHCLKRGMAIFSRLNPYLVETESLEAAELVKLCNNTFRDVSFAFANEVALICDSFNIDAIKLINAANEGYPRNKIALPSPGVGGMCLPKDSILYSHSKGSDFSSPDFGRIARTINNSMPDYVSRKVIEWAEFVGMRTEDVRVVIFGAAFKGVPETSDLRKSPSLEVFELLRKYGVQFISVRDSVVSDNDLRSAGFDHVWDGDFDLGSQAINCILILNNHISHKRYRWNEILSKLEGKALVFDAWGQLNQNSILSHDGISYGRLGGVLLG